MRPLPEKIALVVPCYNEARRFSWEAFDAAPENLRLLFVNDGSSDATAQEISRRLTPQRQLLDLPRNVGKAEAVRAGVLHLRQQPFFGELDWFGYWDADLATPFSQLAHFLTFAQHQEPAPQAVFGSRVKRLGSRIERHWQRHYLGRIFATAVKLALGVDSYDSQCGAKLFRPALLEPAFAQPFLSRWCFDVELLMRLRGRALLECPLQEWRDVSGGALRVGRVAPRILWELFALCRHYR